MLSQIMFKHADKTFAVLGSAPSVRNFTRHEEVAIGVNGASRLLKKGDYFLSMYKGAHHRSWFQNRPDGISCILRPHSALYSNKLFADEKLRRTLVSHNEEFMNRHPEQTQYEVTAGGVIRYVSKEYEPEPNWLQEFPEPQAPHLVLREVDKAGLLSKDIKKINPAGTSACTAIQIAFLMGASEIHLYGIEFSNYVDNEQFNGKNYFYSPDDGEGGRTLVRHVIDTDRIVSIILDYGIPVYSHGPTALRNTIRVEVD
jgi:hypothetical protein